MKAGWVNEPSTNEISSVPTIKQTTTINSDKSETSESQFYIEDESCLRDTEYLLKLHNYNPRCFELVSAKNSKWNQGGIDNMRTLYSSKITVKPKPVEMTNDDIKAFFDNLDRNYSQPTHKIVHNYLSGDKLLLIDISDLHLNLQASMLTTGNEYNCDIAEELFFYVLNDILSRTQLYTFEKIIFTIGGDFFNSDTLSNTTTKGTPQTDDVHMFDAYERGCTMTIKAIDMLKEFAPVDVIYISGNHDYVSSWKMAKFIEAWFRNEDLVKVDTSPLPRKYVKFGETLFVFAHDGDLKTLPKLIPDEARSYWSDIKYTEVFLQHLHSEQVLMEDNNMRIQRLPTISAKSKWTNDKGYNSKRQCKSFIYDKNNGLTDVLYTIIKN